MKRARAGLAVLVAALLLPGCPTHRSGGDRGAFLAVGTGLDPGQLVGINEVVAVRFNKSVDPESLAGNVLIFASGSVAPAVGRFEVAGEEVRFLPQLPARADLSDAGLRPDTHYTICVPASGTVCAPGLPPGGPPLRSRSGKRLERPFEATFRTLPGPVPFRDPVPGPPTVIALIPQAGTTEVPRGSSQAPTVIRAVWTEPVLPATVTAASIGLWRRGEAFAVPVTVTLEQAVAGPVHVVLTPRAPLPCGSDLEVRWTSAITDLVGEPAAAPALFPGVRTVACTGPLAIVEPFDDNGFQDPAPALPASIAWQGAGWDARDSGVLRAGWGFGGSGRNGALVVAAGTTLDLESGHPGQNGLYEFESVSVAGTLTTSGSAPVRVLSIGDVTVDGIVDLDGGNGAPGPAMDTSAPVSGGAGRAGGGNGGTANPVPGSITAPIATRGRGPQANIGGGWGGNDSHFGTVTPMPERPACGGGGGSYGGLGLNGNLDCVNAGASGSLRGNFYGDPAVGTPLGGSGGGGGGNAAPVLAPPLPFPNLVSRAGGGGGAGGGGLAIECTGTFTLGPGGRIRLSGGNGGLGGGPAAGKGGDGGGGSGGALKVQALTIALVDPGSVRALGGTGTPLAATGMGGTGRVRLEDFDGAVGGTNLVQPAPSVAVYAPPGNGRTVAQSLWYDSSLLDPAFAFDGTDPQTGFALGSTADLLFAPAPGAGQTVRITFQGAPVDPLLPSEPDPDATRWFPPQPSPQVGVTWATDVASLSGRGLRFLRIRIELDVGRVQFGQPLPGRVAIDRLQVRVQ
jgi:hypothetical protein